jgi:hypothetical protein
MASPTTLSVGDVIVGGEDWFTQGDWLTRFGRQFACLCAGDSPYDDVLQSDKGYTADVTLGRVRRPGDTVRCWIQSPQTDDSRVLYNPCLGFRRDSHWDDHGEVYSADGNGPDLKVQVNIADGIHRLSLYFVNTNGQVGSNRYRDFVVECSEQGRDPEHLSAKTRVVDFSGGVYKSFIVRGPAKYDVVVRRNASLNATVAGVFVDKINGKPSRFDKMPMVFMGNLKHGIPEINWELLGDNPILKKAVFAEDGARVSGYLDETGRAVGIFTLRIVNDREANAIKANLRERLHLWGDGERRDARSFYEAAWHAHQKLNGKE